MIFALLKPFILPNQMTAGYFKNPAKTSNAIMVQKAVVLSYSYSTNFQPVLQMHLLQEEQHQQNVNFRSLMTTELIMSALITKPPTIKPGAEQ